MNFDGIVKVCDTFDLAHSTSYGEGTERGEHISIACPLALRTHSSPEDENLSCSVKIDEDGPSVVFCHSLNCGFEGTLVKLVEEATAMRPRFRPGVSLLVWLEKHEKVNVSAKCARLTTKLAARREITAAVYARRRSSRDGLPESKLDPFSTSYAEYAQGRGISEAAYAQWELRYDAKRSRLVFPVRERGGGLVGMTGRDVTGERHPKWFNYSGLSKSKYLYGGWLMKPGLPVVLVEGPIDAVRVWQALEGVNTVACMGSGLSKHHATTIKNMRPSKVYLFPDGDSAGKVMAQKAVKLLTPLVLRLMKTPKGMDPASLAPEQVQDLMNASVPVLKNIRWTPA